MNDEDMSENDRLFLSQAQKLGEKIERITELEAENARLREALLGIADGFGNCGSSSCIKASPHGQVTNGKCRCCFPRGLGASDNEQIRDMRLYIQNLRRHARAALQEGSDD